MAVLNLPPNALGTIRDSSWDVVVALEILNAHSWQGMISVVYCNQWELIKPFWTLFTLKACNLRLGEFVHASQDVQEHGRASEQVVGQSTDIIFHFPVLRVHKVYNLWWSKHRKYSILIGTSFGKSNVWNLEWNYLPTVLRRNCLVVFCHSLPYPIPKADIGRLDLLDPGSLSEDQDIVQARRFGFLGSAVCKALARQHLNDKWTFKCWLFDVFQISIKWGLDSVTHRCSVSWSCTVCSGKMSTHQQSEDPLQFRLPWCP